jgi:hypothetical protein
LAALPFRVFRGSIPQFPSNLKQQPSTEKQIMAETDDIQQNDDALNKQLQTFKNTIGNYSTVPGVTVPA